jgi:hypothetical protein
MPLKKPDPCCAKYDFQNPKTPDPVKSGAVENKGGTHPGIGEYALLHSPF